MAAYVDDMCLPAEIPSGGHLVRGKWSHLMADTHDELMAIARAIGLRPEWIQRPGEPGEHFDVVKAKRAAAIRAGAKPITWREAGELAAGRRRAVARDVCDTPDCGKTGRLYPGGRRCDDHEPRRQPLPPPPPQPPAPRPERAWPDLSHGHPGHWCVLPGAERQDSREAVSPPPPVLLTASREGVTAADVEAALRPRFAPGRELIAGGARGGDTIGARLWRSWGGAVRERTVTPEEWDRSRGAGIDRDRRMVAEAAAEGGECVAVIARCSRRECGRREPRGSHGAVATAEMARAAGLPVGVHRAGLQADREAGS